MSSTSQKLDLSKASADANVNMDLRTMTQSLLNTSLEFFSFTSDKDSGLFGKISGLFFSESTSGNKQVSKEITVQEDQFRLGSYIVWKNPIGSGSFSDVYKGIHSETKQIVAIKGLRINSKTNLNRIHFEINIMKDLEHPNIVKLFEVIDSIDEGRIYLIMEYCSGGTLDKYIETDENLTEKQIHHYIKDLSVGLSYLRSKNILHRDLKPHNLLISEDNNLKISDFGLSTLLENDKMTDTLCGSPLYMAPEVLMNNIYGVKSDLWSVGIILYQLIYGKHPYKFTNMYELIQEINKSVIAYPPTQVSQNCLNLIKGLLQPDNNLRLCWGAFFMHPWLKEVQFIENDYKISQPMKIQPHKSRDGFVNDHLIANYQPSYCDYEPICKSAPTPRVPHLSGSSINSSVIIFDDKPRKKGQRFTVSYISQ